METWCFGAGTDGTNVLTDATQGVQYLLEIREHVVKEIIDAEGILDVVKLIPQPQKWVQNRVIEQNVDAPVPQIQEQSVDGMEVIPRKRVQQHTVERTVDVPMSQSTKETVEAVQIIPPERVPMRPGDNKKFVLIRNAGDKRDDIDEMRKKFSTLKDMRMLITGGWRENSNDLTEGGLVKNTGTNIEGSLFRSD